MSFNIIVGFCKVYQEILYLVVNVRCDRGIHSKTKYLCCFEKNYACLVPHGTA